MPPLTNDHPVISSTLSLASGFLSAQLRVEVSLARPSFSPEFPLSDSHENAMETLPAVLAKEAAPMLRQILQAVEAQLLSRLESDRSLNAPFIAKMYAQDSTGAES